MQTRKEAWKSYKKDIVVGVISKLKSDWVMMYSKAQYLEIYKTIDAELEKLGISRYYWTTTGTIMSGAETPAPTDLRNRETGCN